MKTGAKKISATKEGKQDRPGICPVCGTGTFRLRVEEGKIIRICVRCEDTRVV